jgi:hypothetical protein
MEGWKQASAGASTFAGPRGAKRRISGLIARCVRNPGPGGVRRNPSPAGPGGPAVVRCILIAGLPEHNPGRRRPRLHASNFRYISFHDIIWLDYRSTIQFSA